MEFPYVSCINCGKPIGHIYKQLRETRDSGEFDERALKKVDPKISAKTIAQFRSNMRKGEMLETALNKIGLASPDKYDEFVGYRNELLFDHLKLRRICCRTNIINPAITAQQAIKPPEWSTLIVAIPDNIHRILDMRGHTLVESNFKTIDTKNESSSM